jgi:hypothetical protein
MANPKPRLAWACYDETGTLRWLGLKRYDWFLLSSKTGHFDGVVHRVEIRPVQRQRKGKRRG